MAVIESQPSYPLLLGCTYCLEPVPLTISLCPCTLTPLLADKFHSDYVCKSCGTLVKLAQVRCRQAAAGSTGGGGLSSILRHAQGGSQIFPRRPPIHGQLLQVLSPALHRHVEGSHRGSRCQICRWPTHLRIIEFSSSCNDTAPCDYGFNRIQFCRVFREHSFLTNRTGVLNGGFL
jgi:hypothetical protein